MSRGFKIDFMDRDDQQMVDFYERAAATAEYHLMCDFHEPTSPCGLSRKVSQRLNYEGVHGLEQMKWSGRFGRSSDTT